MTIDAKAYLPKYETVTICKYNSIFLIVFVDFLKDLISGKKKYVKSNEI